jgi:hypothetical protein
VQGIRVIRIFVKYRAWIPLNLDFQIVASERFPHQHLCMYTNNKVIIPVPLIESSQLNAKE